MPDYHARHRAMLVLQEQIAPFTPTLRDLLETWGLSSINSVHHTLQRLDEMGLVVKRKTGATTRYYAVTEGINVYECPTCHFVGLFDEGWHGGRHSNSCPGYTVFIGRLLKLRRNDEPL